MSTEVERLSITFGEALEVVDNAIGNAKERLTGSLFASYEKYTEAYGRLAALLALRNDFEDLAETLKEEE